MTLNRVMKLAIEYAAKTDNEVPVCAIIEKEGKILSIQTNKKENLSDITAHAEILAIKEASKKLNISILKDCNMYVTLEPCPMCAWAILNSGIKNVYFGAYDSQYGAMGSKINLINISKNKPDIYGGIMEEECRKLILDFFQKIRTKQ